METEDSTLAATCHFTTLPQELLEMILLQLDVADIWRLRNLTRNFSSRSNSVFLKRRRMERSYLPYLPREVLENIFQYLSIFELWNFRKLSRLFHAIIINYVWNMTSLDLGRIDKDNIAWKISRIELDKMVNVRTIKSICGWDKHVFHKLLKSHLREMTDLEKLSSGDMLSGTVKLLNSRPRNLLQSLKWSFFKYIPDGTISFGSCTKQTISFGSCTKQTMEQAFLVMNHNSNSLKTLEFTLLGSKIQSLYGMLNVNVLQELTVDFGDGKFAPQLSFTSLKHLSLTGISVDLSQSNFSNLEKLSIRSFCAPKLPMELIQLKLLCIRDQGFREQGCVGEEPSFAVEEPSFIVDLLVCELLKLKQVILKTKKSVKLPNILPELEYFTIDSRRRISFSTCQFPKLTYLDVDLDCVEFEFTNIPPQLKHLRLDAYYCPEFSPSSSCQFGNLETLHISGLNKLCFPVSPSLRTLVISHAGSLTLHQAGSSVEPFPMLQNLTLNIAGRYEYRKLTLIFEWRVVPVVLPKELVSLFCEREYIPLSNLEVLSSIQELTTVKVMYAHKMLPLINSLGQISRLIITDLEDITPTKFLARIDHKWENRIDIEIHMYQRQGYEAEKKLNKQFGDKLNCLVRLMPASWNERFYP